MLPHRFFYASVQEVHVERDRQTAKCWLQPVRLQRSGGLRPSEMRRITRTVVESEALFMEAWNERFNTCGERP